MKTARSLVRSVSLLTLLLSACAETPSLESSERTNSLLVPQNIAISFEDRSQNFRQARQAMEEISEISPECTGTERCNGIDDDCNGLIDDQAMDARYFYRDQDGDGLGNEEDQLVACEAPEGYVERHGDLNDSDETLLENCEGLCRQNGIISVLEIEHFLSGSFENQQLGRSIASGDLNDDGFSELIVGDNDNYYLTYGPEIDPAHASLILHSSSKGTFVGSPLINDDVNGDSFDDLVAAFVSPDQELHICVLFGKSRPLVGMIEADDCDSTFEAGIVGENPEIFLTTGDLTRDGAAEIIVGSPQDDTIETNAGAIYVFDTFDPTAIMARFGARYGEMLGDRITTIDFDGNHAETLVWSDSCVLRTWNERDGEHNISYSSSCPNQLFSFDQTTLGLVFGDQTDLLFSEPLVGPIFDNLSQIVSADLDGDRQEDLIIASAENDEIAVFYGPISSSTEPDLLITGGHQFTIGNADGDDINELYISDPSAENGTIYVIHAMIHSEDES